MPALGGSGRATQTRNTGYDPELTSGGSKSRSAAAAKMRSATAARKLFMGKKAAWLIASPTNTPINRLHGRSD
jgi:hypothetical protein